MTTVEYIVQTLKDYGISTVFGYQGGNISYLIDSIVQKGLSFISNYNEQASSFAANAFADVSNSFGVAISSSGPGAINMLNGMANAFYDGIPCLFITGDVNSSKRQKYVGVRQSEFQEVSIIQIASPVVKKCFDINNADELPHQLKEAINIMLAPRKGPVLINIPHDIQKEEILCLAAEDKESSQLSVPPQRTIEDEIIERLSIATNPIVILGNGARHSRESLSQFLDTLSIPFVSTLKGCDILPDKSNFLGLAGTFGTEAAKKALKSSDLILILGARIDSQVYNSIEGFEDKIIIHIDSDLNELNKYSSKDYLRCKTPIEGISFHRIVTEISNRKGYWEIGPNNCQSMNNNRLQNRVNFRSFFSTICLPTNAICCLDVGLHQMAAAKYLRLSYDNRLICSGGLGSMGYSLPAAIGAYYASPSSPIISFSGDGGFQMNIQELETIKRESLPIKLFVLNNKCLGMIRRYQDLALGGRHYATVEGFSSPNYRLIAKAYSLPYFCINEVSNMAETITRALNFDGASLTVVNIPIEDNID